MSRVFRGSHYVQENTGQDYTYPAITQGREYSAEEIILGDGSIFATNSLMMRTDFYQKRSLDFWENESGDYAVFMYSAICGRIYCMADVMSTYNYGVSGSWSMRTNGSAQTRIAHLEELIAKLQEIDDNLEGVYHEAFEAKIRLLQFEIYRLTGNRTAAKKPPYRELYRRARKNAVKARLKEYCPWMVSIKNILTGRK